MARKVSCSFPSTVNVGITTEFLIVNSRLISTPDSLVSTTLKVWSEFPCRNV